MNYLIILGLIGGIILDFVFAFFYKSKQRKIKILNFELRIHHTFEGVLISILGLFYKSIFFISLGVGIILSHTIRTKEFIFIKMEKWKKRK